MTAPLILLCVVGWLFCGVLAARCYFEMFQAAFPSIAATTRVSDIMFGVSLIPCGPASLFVAGICFIIGMHKPRDFYNG